MSKNNVDAETRFREAFRRLKIGCPVVLEIGAPVTQNNVAKEAGRDPSALRKDRYPDLIEEIQAWIAKSDVVGTDKVSTLKLRDRIRFLEARVKQLECDRDLAQSLLVQAHDRIVVLSQQNEKLTLSPKPDNVRFLD
ncbi:hypothetical protein [Pseudomonas oryzihabitans]|uniref:hypothetical protein n=1 Tax=Pseudomonas oryzihabitans TaxID=47885 RepID=UPI0028645BD2|nr:hypothetical protein [Pseudomonas psychrotolerans]MDR6679509.1 hypothetical protein [Pseudomonas psychrotolerans]